MPVHKEPNLTILVWCEPDQELCFVISGNSLLPGTLARASNSPREWGLWVFVGDAFFEEEAPHTTLALDGFFRRPNPEEWASLMKGVPPRDLSL